VPDASKLNIGTVCCNRSNSRGRGVHPACGPCGDPVGYGRPAHSWERCMKSGRLRAGNYGFSAWLCDRVDRFD